MSDARPLPSQTTTGTGGVSRRYSRTIEITFGPPSTMRATTGTPWPIPALKKERKRKKKKKREKNTKPANQRNKKRNRKHKLKLLSLGEVTIYEGIKMKIYRKSFHRIFPADSIRCCCPLPAAPGAQGPLRLWLLYFQGWVSGGEGKARNGLVGEALGPQPKDWKLNVILSKSHLYPGVPFLTWKWGGKNAALLTVLRKMPEWFFLLKTIKISWRHILTWCINSWLN